MKSHFYEKKVALELKSFGDLLHEQGKYADALSALEEALLINGNNLCFL